MEREKKISIRQNIFSFLFIVAFLLINIPLMRAILLSFTATIILFFFFALGFTSHYFSSGKEKKYFLRILICFGLLNLAFLTGWLPTPWPVPGIQHKDLCLSFLSEGTIYGGQPYCAQGPIFYLIAQGIQRIPGDEMVSFQLSALLLLFCIFFLLYFIKRKVTNDTSSFFLMILFIVYFVKVASDDFASLIALFFLSAGLFFLFCHQHTYKEIIAGILLGFSVFTKAQFLIPALVTIFFYSLYALGTNGAIPFRLFKIQKKEALCGITAVLKIVNPIILLFLVLFFFFPHFVDYFYIGQLAQAEKVSLQEAFHIFATFTYASNGFFLLFYLFFLIGVLRIIHNRAIDLFSFVSTMVSFFFFIKMFQVYSLSAFLPSYRYLFALMPFYILNLYLFKKEFPYFRPVLKWSSCLFFLMLLFFLYQGIGGIHLEDFTDGTAFNEERLLKKMRREISEPLFEIPRLDYGKVLVTLDYIKEFQDTETNNPFHYLQSENFENIAPEDPYGELRPDSGYAPYLVEKGIVASLDPYLYEYPSGIVLNETVILEKYPVLIDQWYYDSLTDFILEHWPFFRRNYCHQRIGMLLSGYDPEIPLYLDVYFQDEKECQKIQAQTIAYYRENYASFCERGPHAERVIAKTLEKTPEALVGLECHTLIRTTEYMDAYSIKAIYLAFFVCCFLIIAILRGFFLPFSLAKK